MVLRKHLFAMAIVAGSFTPDATAAPADRAGRSQPVASRLAPCSAARPAAIPLRPAIKSLLHDKLSLTFERRVEVPHERFVRWFRMAPLERLLRGTDDIPSVVATRPLNDTPFGDVGARRLVCLSDGGTAVEEVLRNNPGTYFAYVVWGYTSRQAEPVDYGYGEFWFSAQGQATQVRWRYSFALKPDRFPGKLGAVGRGLFQWTFLDSTYGKFMRSGLEAIAEEAAVGAR